MSNVNVKIGADSSQFNSAMRQMSQELRATESELKVVSENARLFGSNTDYLSAQVDLLSNRLEAQNAMLASQGEYISTLTATNEELCATQEQLVATLAELNTERQEAIAEYGAESEAVQALNATILELNAEYATLGSSIERNTSKLNSATVKMNNTQMQMDRTKASLNGVNNELATAKLDGFNNAMSKTSDVTGAVASKMMPMAMGITAVGGASAYASLKFSDSLAKLSTIADTSKVSIGSFKDQILALSNQTGESASSISESCYQAISSGMKTGNIMKFVADASKLAKAGFTDTTHSVDLLTTILNSYGMKASDVNNISNDLIRTQNLGKTTVNQLSESMGQVIPIAKESGVNIQQLSSAFVELTQRGITTAESGTIIKGMLSELTKSGSKSDLTLKKLTGEGFAGLMKSGKSVGDVLNILNQYAKANGKSMSDMFGNIRAGEGSLVFAGNSGKDFNNILAQMNKQGNDTNIAFEKISNTAGFKLHQSLTQLVNAGIKLGDTLQPAIEKIASGISKLATSMQKLSPAQMKMITNAGLMVVGFTALMKILSITTGAIATFGTGLSNLIGFFIKDTEGVSGFTKMLGVLKSGLGLVTGAFRILWSVITLNPFTIILTALVAVGIALVEAYNHVKWFHDMVNNAFTAIKNVFNTFINFVKGIFAPIFSSVVNNLKQPLSNFLTACSALWNEIKSIFSSFTSFLSGTFSPVFSSIFSTIGSIAQALEPVISAVISVITGVFSAFIGFLAGTFCAEFRGAFEIAGAVIKTFLGVATAIIHTITGVIEGLASFVSGVFTGNWSGAWNGIVQIFSSVFGGIKNIASSIMNGVISVVESAFGVVKGIISSIFGAFDKVASVASNIGHKVAGALGFAVKLPAQQVNHNIKHTTGFASFASIPNGKQTTGFASISDNIDALSNVANNINSYAGIVNSSSNGSIDIDRIVDKVADRISNSITNAINKNNSKVKTVIEVPVNIDGRQVAKASAKYMDSELNTIKNRNQRLGGLF